MTKQQQQQCKLPKSVKIGSIVFTVTNDPFKVDERGTKDWGCILYRESLIYVDTSLTLDVIKETLLHEVMHGVFCVFNIDSEQGEEKVIGPLSSGLMAVFVDNPVLTAFLTSS